MSITVAYIIFFMVGYIVLFGSLLVILLCIHCFIQYLYLMLALNYFLLMYIMKIHVVIKISICNYYLQRLYRLFPVKSLFICVIEEAI